MKIIGVDIKARTCAIVVMDNSKGDWRVVNSIDKIAVNDTSKQEELKTFLKTLSAFVRESKIDKVFLKSRNKKGSFAGGADGFKLEALIQLLDIEVVFVSPIAIASYFKKKTISEEMKVFTYQEDALKTALTGAAKK